MNSGDFHQRRAGKLEGKKDRQKQSIRVQWIELIEVAWQRCGVRFLWAQAPLSRAQTEWTPQKQPWKYPQSKPLQTEISQSGLWVARFCCFFFSLFLWKSLFYSVCCYILLWTSVFCQWSVDHHSFIPHDMRSHPRASILIHTTSTHSDLSLPPPPQCTYYVITM